MKDNDSDRKHILARRGVKKINRIPFDFVLEKLEKISPVTKRIFGCYGVYAGGRILLILRNKEIDKRDNGVWVATSFEHHSSLKLILPSMRSLHLFGDGKSGWQNIPFESPDFEERVMTVCDLILRNDSRIGKVPKIKTGRSTKMR